MADYNLLSQMQGPDVSVSLFGDAFSQGVNAGNNLPTETTARIQGAIKGLGQGQQLVQNQQQIELTNNQIEQLPVENQLRQEALTNAKLTNEARKLSNIDAKQNGALALEAKNAQLKETISANQAATQNRQQTQEFNQNFQNSDPQTQAQMVMGGQYAQVFADNPQLYKQSLERIYANPNSGLDAKTKQSIGVMLNKTNIQDSYQKQAQTRQPKYIEAESALMNDPVTGELTATTGYSPQQVYQNAQFVNSGTYKTAPDGKTVLTRNGQPEIDQEVIKSRGGAPPISYDVMFKNPNTGRYEIIAQGLDKSTKTKFDTWKNESAIQDGAYMRSDLKEVDRQAAKASGSAQTQNRTTQLTNPFSTATAQEGAAQQPLRLQIAKTTLGLDDNQLQTLDPVLKDYETAITATAGSPKLRSEPGMVLKLNSLKDTMARGIASEQFKASPLLQSQYTTADVAKYNAAQESAAVRTLSGGAIGAKIGIVDPDRVKEMVAPFLATSPEDLYYKKQSPIINQNIQYLTNQYADIANRRTKAAINRQSGTQKLMSDLAGIASGE